MKAVDRIRWLTIGAVFFTAVSIGILASVYVRSLVWVTLNRDLSVEAASEAKQLQLGLSEIQNDVSLLGTMQLTHRVLDAKQNNTNDEGSDPDKNELADLLINMLQAKTQYDQVRLISCLDNGQEIIRVERTGSVVHRTADEQLQNKSNREYYQDAIVVPPGETYFSHINLNRENGKIQTPHRPMLRVAKRIDATDGRILGIAIINVSFESLIEKTFTKQAPSHQRFITNSQGDYLVHPDRSRTFGFDLGNRNRISDEWDIEVDQLDRTRNRVNSKERGEVLEVQRVQMPSHAADPFLVIGLSPDENLINSQLIQFMVLFVVATMLVCILALLIAAVVARIQTRSLSTVTGMVETVSAGGDLPPDDPEVDKDFEPLVKAIRSMNESIGLRKELENTNNLLENANDDLAHFVHIAAHDLREPLRKQCRLIDLIEIDRTQNQQNNESIQMFEMVKDCSLRMQFMIDSFRELTRLQQLEISREKVNLPDLIQNTLDELSEDLNSKNATIEFDEFPQISIVFPGLIKVLYSNLIQNAFKYATGDFVLRFTANHVENEWFYGVYNSNSAIAEGKSEEVFKLFRRADSNSDSGTGVGLSVCRKIVQQHRGQITAANQHDGVLVQFSLGEEHYANQTRE